jgi:hypothetical protein
VKGLLVRAFGEQPYRGKGHSGNRPFGEQPCHLCDDIVLHIASLG